ncbi:MAG TPA: winged helix-turn-helix domain-containing protein [Terriglobia bacterium]|nr:winged helix-turn-helix domain-containing protein [Terriglobia bacterium]
METTERVLLRDGRPVALTPKAFDTLLALVQRPGETVTTQELLGKVWLGTFVEEGNVKVTVSALRKALGDDLQNGNRIIETVPRRGYRFVPPVTERREAVARSGSGAVPPVDGDAAGRGPRIAVPTAIGVVAVVVGCVWLLVRPLPPPTVSNAQQLTNDGLPKGYMATDGQRLYFTERASTGEYVLKQMSVNGGESSTMPVQIGDKQFPAVSPDRSYLLLSSEGAPGEPIWLLPLPSGSPGRLGYLLGSEADWSPDGRKIAYCNGNKLFLANRDGSDPHTIASVEGDVSRPRWSPDGSRLRFTTSTSTATRLAMSLWEVSADGSGRHRLLPGWNNPPREGRGSWTPDGEFFVFVSERDAQGRLWAIRERRSGIHRRSYDPVQLTDMPEYCDFPLPSPDGKRIFFLGGTERGRLDHFSRVEKEFVAFLGGISAKWVTYSPDGNWIAYVKYPEDTLWRMRRDGTDALQLTFSPMRLNGVAWSPDGKQIAINAWTASTRFKNYLVDAKGGDEPRAIQRGHHEMEGLPSWSPDGRKIAFGDVPEMFGHATRSNVIHILDIPTGRLETLPGSGGFWTPRWSQDGRYIAALKDDEPDPRRQPLFLFDWKTGTWRVLHADHVKDMLWSHDGKYVYYDDEVGHGIFRVRVPNGKPELVADTNEILRSGGGWFGLAPDDSPLIVRDAGSEEIYSVDVDWH